MKVTFVLETAADYFAQWLKRYISRRAPFFVIPLKSGEEITIPLTEPEEEVAIPPEEPREVITLVLSEIPDHITGPTHITIDGYLSPADELPSQPYPLPGMIVFDVTPLGKERAEVLALCSASIVMKHFKEILEAIAERWSSAAEPIAKALGTLVPQATPVEDGKGNKPWEKIPDESYNRRLVELWWDGYTSKEIGEQLRYSPKTILNRLSDLRKIYGEEIVPIRRDKEKAQIRTK